MEQTLREGLPGLGLSLSDEIQKTLCAFGHAVIEQNKVMNLTAITEPAQVAKLHLLDSLTVLAAESLEGPAPRSRAEYPDREGSPSAQNTPRNAAAERVSPRRN